MELTGNDSSIKPRKQLIVLISCFCSTNGQVSEGEIIQVTKSIILSTINLLNEYRYLLGEIMDLLNEEFILLKESFALNEQP
ncbi:hypothetical protein [Paenibacillus sp. ACRRY]|uniref:hypothetical protein n=1 Tax=Paenibacillus sp. ACRRY TaxID=2918208 RepID=UPI001EF49B5F|nr:hypothetical protein [Paenibacillus sp. ACRRY]